MPVNLLHFHFLKWNAIQPHLIVIVIAIKIIIDHRYDCRSKVMRRKTKFSIRNGYWFWAASFDGNTLHNWFPERDQMLAVKSRRFMLSIAMANWTQYVRYSFYFSLIRCLLDSIHCCCWCLVCYPCGNAEWFTFSWARSVSTSQHPTHSEREKERVHHW